MKWLLLLPLLVVGLVDLTLSPAAPSEAPARSYVGTPAEVARIGIELQAAFGVRVSGQWRSMEQDARIAEETGRTGVSDHVYGMALDVVGSGARLDALAAYLRGRADVRIVLWRVRDHYDHLHVSFR